MLVAAATSADHFLATHAAAHLEAATGSNEAGRLASDLDVGPDLNRCRSLLFTFFGIVLDLQAELLPEAGEGGFMLVVEFDGNSTCDHNEANTHAQFLL